MFTDSRIKDNDGRYRNSVCVHVSEDADSSRIIVALKLMFSIEIHAVYVCEDINPSYRYMD